MANTLIDQTRRGALLQDLPFAGLGFDLGAVQERAAQLVLTSVIQDESEPVLAAMEKPLAGYELLLLQGREIRAG